MKTIDITVRAEDGLHARPAAALVKICSKMNSDIRIENGEKSCNAKSMMGVLKLGVKKGTVIRLTVDGGDEDINFTELTSKFDSLVNAL
ncbi:HPr family phosphocarrier protein [Vibrio panuliri]|uniref:HPr domain-containing protein n=1 Tax=Vibrio panuliri TaxID=1381081 RepID=A0A1Q9HEP1_9VIBR|nr:HPr family phosphocarrier protein [Vibrio panuliri]KAB1454642.1 HPr family phosphocarrier protein [Vibrio panuliri]OLQ88202.1 hypothetical protein BIY22_08530 [Vibrio panuliri]OLQ96603.1 hypothetical protein BIY20_18475 [Vibrio panuliri]